MSSSASPVPVDIGVPHAEEELLLAWRIFRARREPRGLFLVLFAYATALAMWHLLLPHPIALFLPLVALTSALREYLFPITYRVTTRGAYMYNGPAQLFVAWADVQRATYGADGVFLSPLAHPSRLDAFRGVCLRFVDNNEEAVLAAVRQQWRSRFITTQESESASE